MAIKTLSGQSATNVILDTYPFIVPSSGSVTVTTGAILLTTALDKTYANCYMYFPANTFTGSAAGFYYCTMSSTTAGTMYTTLYSSGIPTTPTSPTVVTTGAGAYTQTVGAYLPGQTYTIPANTMGANTKLYMECPCARPNNANTTIMKFNLAGLDQFGGNSSAGVTLCDQPLTLISKSSQSQQVWKFGTQCGFSTANMANAQTLVVNYRLAVATDYLINNWVNVQIQG